MGLSVTFSNIYLTKLERDTVTPMKPIFYRRYVDGYINRRDKNARDTLFESLNNYHKKIKFTIEKDPSKFLDTEIVKTPFSSLDISDP